MLRSNDVLGVVRKDPRADGDELRDWLLRAGQMPDLFGGDWRRMCVVLDEALRPDWLVGALDDSSTRAGCRSSSRASRTSSGLSGSSWRLTMWGRASARLSPWILRWLNSEFVESGRFATTAQSATAKQIADECGDDLHVALARSTCCKRSALAPGAVGERADRVLPPRRARDLQRAAAERLDWRLGAPAGGGRRRAGVCGP